MTRSHLINAYPVQAPIGTMTRGRPSSDTKTLLLLGAHNDHAREAMARALGNGEVAYETCGKVLILPTARKQMPHLRAALNAQLPAAVQNAVQAVFFRGDLTCATSALSAFVDAEPLPILLARQAHE